MVKIVESATQYTNEVADGTVVVDFFATWCGPCQVIAPKYEAMSKEFSTVKFLKVDVDQLPEVAEKEEIGAMPTFVFYKGGKRVDQVLGANENAIREKIKSVV